MWRITNRVEKCEFNNGYKEVNTYPAKDYSYSITTQSGKAGIMFDEEFYEKK